MFRFVRFFAAAAILAALIAPPNVVSGLAGGNELGSRLDSLLYSAAASSTAQVSAIIELKDEPGAVFKARAEKAGSTVSTDQLKAYRPYPYLPLTDAAVEDGFGHGTHVASTVAGYLAQTLNGTQIHGVAPQARLMSYKSVATLNQLWSEGTKARAS
jgi:subtilisin family serine protease